MDNEEKYLRERFGQKNPFRVPEGYFDQLAEQVMSQLPERRRKSRLLILRPMYLAAASVVAAVVLGLTIHFQQPVEEQAVAVSMETNADNSYIDEVADYAMLDNSEIYACLADN